MIEIETGDFKELSKKLNDNSIDLILTDPPRDWPFSVKEIFPEADISGMSLR